MSESGGTFDLVVLGGGSGGYAAALRAAELDMSVVLIEKDKLGGTCLHRGCIPTKALLHSAEVADSAKDSENFGVKATFEGIDMGAVNKYKDKVVDGLYKGLSGLVKARKITVVEGEGKLTGKDEVTVDGKVYKGKNILLGTGSQPKTLGLEIDGKKVMTSDQALTMDRVPESAIVLGGGVIGVEFASVWRSYGTEVTVVEALKNLVPVEEESSSKLLERAFRKRKIKSELGKPFESVKTTDSGVAVTLEGGKTLEAEILLVAIGRAPVSEGLGYEEQGITLDRGFVQVDENLHTGVGNVYAVGDLIPTLQLAHVGFAEGIFVAEHIAGQNPPAIDYDGVPRVTYCEPEVASVGLTSKVAKERGHEVVEMNYNLAGNGKSQILQTQGAVKVIAEKDGPVLGVHMVGSRMGELVAEGQLIYNWEALPSEVAQLIHPHPSQSEALGEAHLALAGKPLHVHD
ncbi:dihydrolipoyl dehydrogenase [Nocardiopsis kunsanensis]|uniref:Dihydrolipoyl dehydrogenase n=1 Tax=Nocardiopsis kunsanensis TaxID=141693 RepID=A0A919CIK6_9ACTN|nr:dihydrolipoyl dehydrogenase [Nocardiopsis kunsanensis]GHD27390.1 dihydrolipoyl dehydrogenase [Nocardiopsis kunsanensis]